MEKYNHYSEDFEGNLPVRVLQYSITKWLLNTSNELRECINDEITYNGLSSVINYSIDNRSINEIGDIDIVENNSVIFLYENYNQFLWCISYHFYVYFYEAILKPTLANTYTGNVDSNNPIIKNSINVLGLGLDLLIKYDLTHFHKFPNPERYDEVNKENIEKTNSIFVSGVSFIILHEFAHHYLGHTTYIPEPGEQCISEEVAADNYAIACISDKFKDKEGFSYKMGVIVTLLSFFIIQERNLTSDRHPDLDFRLANAIEQLDVESSDHVYGAVANTLKTWMLINNIDVSFEKEDYDCYKDVYDELMRKIKEFKESNSQHRS